MKRVIGLGRNLLQGEGPALSQSSFMINFRVEKLDELLETLRSD